MTSAQECCMLSTDFKNAYIFRERDTAGMYFSTIAKEMVVSITDTMYVVLKQDQRPDIQVTVISAKGDFDALRQVIPLDIWFCEAYCPRIVIMSQDEKTLLRLIYKSDKENPYD
jgi:hypothetical protein